MSLALHLENFDNGAAPGGFSQVIDEPAAGYEKGYEDGLAAGQWEAQQLQSQLRADLVQTISDQALTIEAAQELLLCAITPLFDDVLDTLLPQVLSPAFFTALSGRADTRRRSRDHAKPNRHQSGRRAYPSCGVGCNAGHGNRRGS